MDRETIYLDNDEEVTSVVDKLKGAETAEIDLVIPKEALILQSVVNLKLLKRQAESLGKEITVVTQDKVGKKLATQIGIPVIEKVGEVPKEVKMSEADPVSERDIEFKEEPPSKTRIDDPKTISMDEQADDVVQPTNEVISPLVNKEEKNIDPPENNFKKEEKPKVKKKWKKLALIGAFIFLALLVLAYIYVPLANITVRVAAEKEKIDFTFTADKNATEVKTDSLVLPGREVLKEVEKNGNVKATGKKKVGTKATGTVKIVNHNYSSSPTLIVAGTRLVNSSGLVFKTTANVTVPGFAKVGQSITDGTVTVIAEADQVGANYNINSGAGMTVPGLQGATATDIYATNTTAFAGGESRDITFVTQADINGGKEELTKTLTDELKSQINSELKDGERIVEESLKISEVNATSSVAVNGEAEDFELKAKATAKVLAFKEEDLKKLAENVLGDKIGPAKEIVESGSLLSSTDHISSDSEKGEMTARVSGEAYIATKIEEEKIKSAISGDSESKINEYFSQLDGIDSVEVKFFPRFYKKVPRIKNHIYIKTSINKVQTSQDSGETGN